MHEAESFSLPTPRRLPIPSPPHWSDVSDWVTARQSARIAAGAVTAMQVHSQLSNKPTASQVWDRCKAHEKSQIRYTVKTDQYRLPEYKRQHLREIKSVSQIHSERNIQDTLQTRRAFTPKGENNRDFYYRNSLKREV